MKIKITWLYKITQAIWRRIHTSTTYNNNINIIYDKFKALPYKKCVKPTDFKLCFQSFFTVICLLFHSVGAQLYPIVPARRIHHWRTVSHGWVHYRVPCFTRHRAVDDMDWTGTVLTRYRCNQHDRVGWNIIHRWPQHGSAELALQD